MKESSIFKKKTAMLILILLILSVSLTCVYAEDLNDTGENSVQQPSDVEITSNTADTSESPKSNQSKAILVLDNDADGENFYIGEYITWRLLVYNMGPDTAKNVNVYDQLPDGLKYIRHSASKGTFNPETGIWSIGDLSVNEFEVFLNITTLAETAGKKINKATLTTDSINLNIINYEEEEVDVSEHDTDSDDDDEKSIKSIKTVGNPIALAVLSLFAIFIASRKPNQR